MRSFALIKDKANPRAGMGAGLGLSVAQGIAAQSKGMLRINPTLKPPLSFGYRSPTPARYR
jgi:signal transduction histidine kinase